MRNVFHALVLSLHQPAGNLEALLNSGDWKAKEILFAMDRIDRPHVARYGGEEIIVVVRDRELSAAQQSGKKWNYPGLRSPNCSGTSPRRMGASCGQRPAAISSGGRLGCRAVIETLTTRGRF